MSTAAKLTKMPQMIYLFIIKEKFHLQKKNLRIKYQKSKL